MIDISKLSDQYNVRRLSRKDVQLIEQLQKGHPVYYEFCPPDPSAKSILDDMKALPPNKELKDKYYIGFFDKDILLAVMDLIASYPNKDTVFVGFFMVNRDYCNQGIGKRIIEKCVQQLKNQGFSFIRLCYMKGNLQSEAFWRKCQFENTGIETDNGQGIVVVLERKL